MKQEIKERGILMKAEMVLATLDDRKIHTRRIMKPQPEYRENESVPGSFGTFFHGWNLDHEAVGIDDIIKYCPYGRPGDVLWVQETFIKCISTKLAPGPNFAYRASTSKEKEDNYGYKWTPSIHMPRNASRINLENTKVRYERIQDISEEDARAEGGPEILGFEDMGYNNYRDWFKDLWNSINAKPQPAKFVEKKPMIYFSAPWDESDRDPRTEINGLPHICIPNSYVWVIEFRRIK